MLDALSDVRRQLEHDEHDDQDAVRRRDAALAPGLAKLEASPARQLAAWARAVRGDRAAEGDTLRRASALITTLMLALGAALGAGIVAALLRYDGSVPVNIMPLLWVFVFAQALLLALFALALLPARWLRYVAPLRGWFEFVSACNPGRLWSLAARFLPAGGAAQLASIAATPGAAERDAFRWQLLAWSQHLALGLNLGAAATLLATVSLEDRAFAWSTQVEWLAARLPQLVDLLATPWAAWWPEAAPSSELVAATRYARLDAGSYAGGEVSAADLGRWWPFLLACVLLYGVVPRLLTSIACRARTRDAAARALVRLPGADAALARLNEPVQTAATTHDQARAASARVAPALATPHALRSGRWVLIDWAHTLRGEAPFDTALRLRAGGNTRIEDEARAVREAAAAVADGSAQGVVMAVRGYEPPTLEITDLLADLRDALGEQPLYLLRASGPRGTGASARTSWDKHLAPLTHLQLQVLDASTADNE